MIPYRILVSRRNGGLNEGLSNSIALARRWQVRVATTRCSRLSGGSHLTRPDPTPFPRLSLPLPVVFSRIFCPFSLRMLPLEFSRMLVVNFSSPSQVEGRNRNHRAAEGHDRKPQPQRGGPRPKNATTLGVVGRELHVFKSINSFFCKQPK